MGPSLCSHSVPAELLKQGVLPRASLTSSAQESPGGLPTGPGSQRLFLPQLQQETLRLSLHTQHAPGLLDSQSLRQKKSVILSCLLRQISSILPLPNCCSSHTYHCPQRWLQCGFSVVPGILVYSRDIFWSWGNPGFFVFMRLQCMLAHLEVSYLR